MLGSTRFVSVLCVLTRFAIAPLGKRGLVAGLLWSSECHVLLSFFALYSRFCGFVCSVCECGISLPY